MGGSDSALGVDIKFNFQEIFLKGSHQTDNQLNDEATVIDLQYLICHQQGYIIALYFILRTFIAFFRSNSNA